MLDCSATQVWLGKNKYLWLAHDSVVSQIMAANDELLIAIKLTNWEYRMAEKN